MGDNMEPLVHRTNKLARSISHAQDELHSFRTYLRWMCVDQSNIWMACLSWFMFIVFGLVVPCVSHFLLACPSCDATHARPYDWVVQLSFSSVSALSFVCLTRFVKKYGLRRFLFFDKLCDESETVRKCYTVQLNKSLKMVSIFVFPCFIAETAYKVWWYASGASQVPFLGVVWLSDAVACFMELCSWLYRTTVFFLICVLFQLICNLQVLRLHDFAQVFHVDSDVGSQFTSLLITTKADSDLNIYKTGELAMCSITLLTGLCILLRSATKITHKAQAVTCLASKWHVCATLDSFDANDGETPRTPAIHGQQALPVVGTDGESDGEDAGDEEDDLDNSKLIPAYAYSTISYQKRQALVTYFENNRAGITVYGFMLDRSTLDTIFGIEFSLVLWLLGKTVGIS
ncbi:ethylene-responsive transcription factor 3-like [Hibiscus syriacus]|uniref:Ethylene-responsive transcription factor 3-like n=1 Tax=Hibiscus syriacus TaxID=106335 RepID=A0A6A2YLN4_HIBSY|nr:ethylene-responsive transcription factor 3-like [Hibiscus syriacus]